MLSCRLQIKNAANGGIVCYVTPKGLNSNQMIPDLQKIDKLKGIIY
jgi:hypothetical protein